MAKDEGVRKTSQAFVISSTPSVERTPMGASTPPVPYMIIGRFDNVSDEHPNVLMTKMETITARSRITRVAGDEAGTAGGVMSGVNVGFCRPREDTCASTVLVNGAAVVCNGSEMWMNCAGPEGPGNTTGRVTYLKVESYTSIGPGGEIHGDTNPTVQPETEEERGWWSKAGRQAKGFFRGMGSAAWETGTGLVKMAEVGFRLSPIGMLIDPEGSRRTADNIAETAKVIVQNPGMVWDAIIEPYTTAWEKGEYGEAIGRGAFEVLATIAATKGLDKLGKGAKVTGAVDDLARVSDDAARLADDLTRAGDDLTKIGDDVARLSDDLAKTGKNGVKVTSGSKAKGNLNMAGKRHRVSGVLYDSDGFPIFDAKFDVQLPNELYLARDPPQMMHATKQLQAAIAKDPSLKKQFSPTQLLDIESGAKKIRGYTWHHHQDPGKLQLVDEAIHGSTKPHTGGKKIWGGER